MRSSCAVDVLTDLLQRSRARGAVFSRTTVYGDWGVRFPAGPLISVHAIVAGEAHLWADAPERASRLAPGDVVLVRESIQFQMAHAPGAECVPFADLTRRRRPAPPPRRRRRPAHRVLLRCLRLRGRPVPADAGFAAGDVPAAAGGREHAARDDGPARARDAARRRPDSRRCSTGCSTWRSCRCCASSSRPGT